MPLNEIKKELKRFGNKKYAKALKRFFKTGPGEYAEKDIFFGIRMGRIRNLAEKYRDVDIRLIPDLLKSAIHEERMLALLILTLKFTKENKIVKKKIYDLYLDHTGYINNWDLVDLSAAHIVGAFLAERDKKPLYKLSRSRNMWERRIAIVSTFYYIRNSRLTDTLKIAENLINDQEDLIHKAVGWMLREAGKRNLAMEERFLRKHCKRMPRTMLRYAIERLPEPKRQAYLKRSSQYKGRAGAIPLGDTLAPLHQKSLP